LDGQPATAQDAPAASADRTRENLTRAVAPGEATSKDGLLDRAFIALFSGLVYAQIWEDPVVDMEALQLGPDKRLLTIASGGCNIMSYLTADAGEILAVDLNAHHVALVKLKLAGARLLPNYQTFYRFFGDAADVENPRVYRRFLRAALDDTTRRYWDGRDWRLRRRITLFQRNIYRYGLLGQFIGAGHVVARLLGLRLRDVTTLPDQAAQQAWFDAHVAPRFDSWLVRRLANMKATLFWLGIPPAQYDALASDADGDIVAVLKRRLERLLCDFSLAENYFAQQALTRRYPGGDAGPLPPYLQAAHYEAVKARAERVSIRNCTFTERLAEEPDASLDAYSLLDAQDWMTDAQLNELWAAITRTARPGARVIFRTAASPSLLPGRVDDAILSRWRYEAEMSAALHARDRSAIYGGFHLYIFEG
jgi:S-adenosylmethionine-diacylglycerol 3-amino-3-carboxypropyl transferase